MFGEKLEPDEIDDVDVDVNGDDELDDDDDEPIDDGEFCFFLLFDLPDLAFMSVSGCGD